MLLVSSRDHCAGSLPSTTSIAANLSSQDPVVNETIIPPWFGNDWVDPDRGKRQRTRLSASHCWILEGMNYSASPVAPVPVAQVEMWRWVLSQLKGSYALNPPEGLSAATCKASHSS